MENRKLVTWMIVTSVSGVVFAQTVRDGKTFTNSIGLKMIRIEPGTFLMGGTPSASLRSKDYQGPDWDESPPHRVTMSGVFHMGSTEVTNAQYEQFNPSHRSFRGRGGVSKADDEAVVLVDWDEADRFCHWLSEREYRPYRLPTEAEWEYACRAGTATMFHMGDELPNGFQKINPEVGPFHCSFWFPDKSHLPEVYRIDDSGSLRVAQTLPNAWSLFDMPDRNDHGPAIWRDGVQTLYHINGHYGGLWSEETGAMMGLIMRTSKGDGATWSPARQIGAYGQVSVATLKTQEGYLIISADGPDSTTAIYISKDGGTTWTDPADGRTMREHAGAGVTGPRISGIHAGIVQLEDGRLLALGRHDHPGRQERFNGRAPTSISSDLGRTWTYSVSELPAISSSQRPALLKVKEGPLLYCSFMDMVTKRDKDGKVLGSLKPQEKKGMRFYDSAGNEFVGYGLYAALSYDEGRTWPTRKLMTPGGPPCDQTSIDNSTFRLSATNAEPCGYLALCQARDGVIHLISSKLHYSFNLVGLKVPA